MGGEVYPLTLQTKAGRLCLHVDADQLDGLGTLFTCFDDPQAARQFVDCNRFSGKWNFHFFDGWDRRDGNREPVVLARQGARMKTNQEQRPCCSASSTPSIARNRKRSVASDRPTHVHLWDQTEGDEQYEYSYLEGNWE